MRVALAIACLLLAACSRAPRLDPALYTESNERAAWLAAEAHARDVRGLVYRVLDTHSMEPLLLGGDYIVVTWQPFASVEVGRVITYRADWAPANHPPVTHRLVARDRDGGIASGDNVRPDIDDNGRNTRSEARYRITRETFIGVVFAIYRARA